MNGKEIKEVSIYKTIHKGIKKHWQLYLLLLPMIIWFALWVYKPMGGIIIAFKDYSSTKGIMGSDFSGLYNFKQLMTSRSLAFWQAFRNTFVISLYGILFGFPLPIILAIFFSEIGKQRFRSIVQTISYLPHFLSEVTITSIILFLLKENSTTTGILNKLFVDMGLIAKGTVMMEVKTYFRPIYLIAGIWKETGYSSIVYFAAIMGISPVLYEAFKVEGGNKLQELRYVTLPGISSTLIIMLIMRIGRMLSVGYERVILLVNASTYETGEVISSMVYRYGLESSGAGADLSRAIMGAADLFNTILGFALVISANIISRKVSKTSLW